MAKLPPTIVIHFDDPKPMGYPFTSKWYFESYRRYSALCAKAGAKVYFVRGRRLPLTSLSFKKGWEFVDGKLKAVTHPFTGDLLYLKGERIAPNTGKDNLVLNNADFDTLCLNKLTTHAIIGEYMAVGFPLTPDNWQDAIDRIPTDKIVVKPVYGYGGAEVQVMTKNEFPGEAFFATGHEYLVEEFVDTSAGIPGIVDGTHDMRLLMFNGKITLAYIRTPKKGSLIANLALGGTVAPLDVEKIPAEAQRIAREVDAKFKRFLPRVYSIDFMVGKDRTVVCELNSRPGFPHPDFVGEAFTATFHDALLELMLEAIRAKRTNARA